MKIISDIDRIDFLEERTRLDRTGVSFEWEGHGIYQYTEHNYVGPDGLSLRDAIDKAIKEKRWRAT